VHASSSWLKRPAVLPSDDHVIAGAKKEAEVSLYLSTNLTDANGLIQRFNQKYPFVKVGLYRTENEKLLNRILTEASAGKFTADVILISSFEVRVLMQRKLLQRYISSESQFYPEGFTAPMKIVNGGVWVLPKINDALDEEFLGKLRRNDVNGMAQMAASLFVEGTSEILNWIIVAAAADHKGDIVEYQPLYRTNTGVGCAMGFARWRLS
jgi:hypothetical protein